VRGAWMRAQGMGRDEVTRSGLLGPEFRFTVLAPDFGLWLWTSDFIAALRHGFRQLLPIRRISDQPRLTRIGQITALDQDGWAVLAAEHPEVSRPPQARSWRPLTCSSARCTAKQTARSAHRTRCSERPAPRRRYARVTVEGMPVGVRQYVFQAIC